MLEILRLCLRVNYAKRNVNLVIEYAQSLKDKTITRRAAAEREESYPI